MKTAPVGNAVTVIETVSDPITGAQGGVTTLTPGGATLPRLSAHNPAQPTLDLIATFIRVLSHLTAGAPCARRPRARHLLL